MLGLNMISCGAQSFMQIGSTAIIQWTLDLVLDGEYYDALQVPYSASTILSFIVFWNIVLVSHEVLSSSTKLHQIVDHPVNGGGSVTVGVGYSDMW